MFKTDRYLKYLIYITILAQLLLLCFYSTFNINNNQLTIFNSYPISSYQFTILDGDNNFSSEFSKYIEDQIKKNNISILKMQPLKNGLSTIYNLQIASLGNLPELSIYGKDIINNDLINKVNKLDYDNNKIEINALVGSKYTLSSMINDLTFNDNYNGVYKVYGLSESEFNTFIDGLSNVINIDSDTLINPKSFSTMVVSTVFIKILLALYIMISFLLIILFINNTVKSYKVFGVATLQGFSSKDFVNELFQKYQIFSLIISVIGVVFSLWLTNFTMFTFSFISNFIYISLINYIIVWLCFKISTISLRFTKPINAIKNIINKKAISFFVVTIIIITNVASVALSISFKDYVDEIIKYNKVKQIWKNYNDYYIVSDYDTTLSDNELYYRSDDMRNKYYKWFKSIEKQEGVYLIKTDNYISEEDYQKYKEDLIQELKIDYELPEHSYREHFYSLNYAREIGLDVSLELEEMVNDGTRVILFPESYSQDDINRYFNVIKLLNKQGKINDGEEMYNKFMQNPTWHYTYYNYPGDFFNWKIDNINDSFVSEPIITLISSENMLWTEIDDISKVNSGLSNSLKIKKNILDEFTTEDYFDKFQLSIYGYQYSNASEFANESISNYYNTMSIILLIIIAVFMVSIISIFILISFYQTINKEKIAISKFLGHSNYKIYRYIFLLMITISLLDIGVGLYSVTSLILAIIIIIVQFSLLVILITKNQFTKINNYLKKDG